MKKGFTLVELLVVIFIVGILTAISLVSYSGAQKQARDTQRRSDLGQYRNALENYAANNSSSYPIKASAGGFSLYTMCSGAGQALVGYLSQCIEDPKNSGDASYIYKYLSDGTGTKYIIYAKVEVTGFYWYVCSTGKIAMTTNATVPTTTNCP